jgi:hypothetical protein
MGSCIELRRVCASSILPVTCKLHVTPARAGPKDVSLHPHQPLVCGLASRPRRRYRNRGGSPVFRGHVRFPASVSPGSQLRAPCPLPIKGLHVSTSPHTTSPVRRPRGASASAGRLRPAGCASPVCCERCCSSPPAGPLHRDMLAAVTCWPTQAPCSLPASVEAGGKYALVYFASYIAVHACSSPASPTGTGGLAFLQSLIRPCNSDWCAQDAAM